MAFYIKHSDPKYVNCIEWHSQSKKPLVQVKYIESIQADGHEMFDIFDRFSITGPDGISTLTIPFSKANVQCWYGDTAKTIFFTLD